MCTCCACDSFTRLWSETVCCVCLGVCVISSDPCTEKQMAVIVLAQTKKKKKKKLHTAGITDCKITCTHTQIHNLNYAQTKTIRPSSLSGVTVVIITNTRTHPLPQRAGRPHCAEWAPNKVFVQCEIHEIHCTFGITCSQVRSIGMLVSHTCNIIVYYMDKMFNHGIFNFMLWYIFMNFKKDTDYNDWNLNLFTSNVVDEVLVKSSYFITLMQKSFKSILP